MENLIGPTIPEEYAATTTGTEGQGMGEQQQQQQLGHEEVWDDSALIDSWEEAVAEYKKYHSIKATGEDPEAIVKVALEEEEKGVAPAPLPPPAAKTNAESVNDEGIPGPTETVSTATDVTKPVEATQGFGGDHYSPPEAIQEDEEMEEPENPNILIPEVPQHMLQQQQQGQQTQQIQQPSMPEALAQASVGNEGLRNLMMAWYWAGYYTGLQEGQAQAQAAIGRPPTS